MADQQITGHPKTPGRGRQRANKPSVLGTIDLSAGMRDDVFSKDDGGIPDAMLESDSWDRRVALDKATPKARPGFEQRWVRIMEASGRPDAANKMEARQSGWFPRKADTLDMSNPMEASLAIYDGGPNVGEIIAFGHDLVLFERREELGEIERKRMRRRQLEQTHAIYQQTQNSNTFGINPRHGGVDFESGRDPTGLIDD